MAIHYPKGKLIYREINGWGVSTIIEGLRQVLVDAGWTLAETTNSHVDFTFSGIPGNGQQLAFGDAPYYWRTTLNNNVSREVKIGATAADCARNFYEVFDCVYGGGTDWSTATTPHPYCKAELLSGTVVRVSYRAGGSAGANAQYFSNSSGVSASTERFTGGGYKLTSVPTEQNLEAMLHVMDPGVRWSTGYGPYTGVKPYNVTGTQGTGDETLIYSNATGRKLQCRAHGHGLWIFILGGADPGDQAAMQFEVPYIREPYVAPGISTITSHEGKYLINTMRPHGGLTNMNVTIAGAKGEGKAINRKWPITVVSPTSFVLEGSEAVSTEFDLGTARAAIEEMGQVSEAFWMIAHLKTSRDFNPFDTYYCFREQSWSNGGEAQTLLNSMPNQYASISLASNLRPADAGSYTTWMGYKDLMEARIGWSITEANSTIYKIGDLWGAFLINNPSPMDILKTGFDGHNWIQFTNNDRQGYASLYITID